MWFNSDFSLFIHVQNVCKSCFVQIRDFRHVRWFLNHDVSVFVTNVHVRSRLDYYKSHLKCLFKFNLCELQCIKRSAARIVSNTSIIPVLKKWYWLPVEHRTIFKTAKLVYKLIHTGFSMFFFASNFSSYSSYYATRHSQSGDNCHSKVHSYSILPSIHKSVCTVWNALPDEICVSPSKASFRKYLKTYLYSKAYPS